MASSPVVSVILPVKNAEVTLARAIESIEKQTLKDWELILVDDHSLDTSPYIAKSHGFKNAKIRLFTNPGSGIVDALNFGIARATGKFIARMDADDYAYPQRLETQVQFLETHTEIGFVGSCVNYCGDREANLGYALYVDWINSLVEPQDIKNYRFVESPFAHPSICFHSHLIESHGGYENCPFPEDYELWLRWIDAGVLPGKCPEILLDWYDSPDRMSRTDSRYRTEAFYLVKAIYLAHLIERRLQGKKEIWVWGAGKRSRMRLAPLLEKGVPVNRFIDIDDNKTGLEWRGIPISDPSVLPDPGDIFLLLYVGSRGAREKIESHLQPLGYEIGRDYLPAA